VISAMVVVLEEGGDRRLKFALKVALLMAWMPPPDGINRADFNCNSLPILQWQLGIFDACDHICLE
jgi:hypothetical protein